jgi:hypothetical protein
MSMPNPLIDSLNKRNIKTLSYIMSDSVRTNDTQITNEASTPSLGVKRSISWASDVKPPREGGMKMGVKYVPLLKKESIQDDSSEEEGQDNETEAGQQSHESEKEEVDDKGDREGDQLKSQHSRGPAGSKYGTKTTITQGSQLPSAATASKIAVSRLPNEPGFRRVGMGQQVIIIIMIGALLGDRPREDGSRKRSDHVQCTI